MLKDAIKKQQCRSLSLDFPREGYTQFSASHNNERQFTPYWQCIGFCLEICTL